MNLRTTVSILLACAFTLLAPPPALADFTGLQTVERTDLPICKDQTQPDIPYKLDVCNVYATFSAPGDRLISVGFSDGSTTDTNGFYQHWMNTTNTAPACAFVALEPTLECDSYTTIGLDCFDLIDGTTSDPDFDITGFNSGGYIAGGWFNSAPSNGQGTPDANGKVLVAQFSVKQNKDVTGTLTVFAKLAGSDEIVEYPLQAFDCSTATQGGGGGTSGSSGGSAPIPSGPETQGAGGGGCPPGTIWYVDVDPIGPSDDGCCDGAFTCNGWDNACPDLQLVLDQIGSGSGHQIWVAAGTYKPTKLIEPPEARTEAFALANCLQIYGGFEGNEDPATFDLDNRDFVANETILSGDIGTSGDDFDNSYHVVVALDVDDTAILDGFTVTKGQADGPGQGPFYTSKNQGSGVNIYGIISGDPSTPKLVNCTFLDNHSLDHGAVNDHGGATLIDCVFRDNEADSHAAGLYVHTDIGTMVMNCQFYENLALGIPGHGGGAYVKLDTTGPEPTFTGCTFSGNQAKFGGGMYCGNGRSPSVTLCTFSANSATGPGPGFIRAGGGMYNDGASPIVDDCQFSGNGAFTAGGAIYNNVCSFPTIRDCTFTNNFAQNGSGVYNYKGSDGQFINCTFTGHHTTVRVGYGSGIYNFGASPIIRNCDFVDGLARYGGGIYTSGSDGTGDGEPEPEGPTPPACLSAYANTFVPAEPQIINCTFIDNEAGMLGVSAGGAIFAEGRGSLTLTNCLFARNRETLGGSNPGGAVTIFDPTFPEPEATNKLTATNCTFVANTATGTAGGLYSRSPTNLLHNCVFWDNVADSDGAPHSDESAQIYLDPAYNAEATSSYSDIMALTQPGPFCDDEFGAPPCEGNIDALPQFVDPLSGTWTTPVPTYNSATDETTFTDSTASFGVGKLVGSILNPNTAQARVSIITANTTTTVTVLSDMTGIGGEGNPYQIDNYHLESGSPCIDRADDTEVPPDIADLDDDGDTGEATPVDLDPKPRFMDDPDTPNNGNPPGPGPRVDMGAYEFAPDCGTCPTDVDDSEDTGPFDLAYLLGSWGQPITDPDALCLDADGDLRIGSFDLAFLLGNWGPIPPP